MKKASLGYQEKSCGKAIEKKEFMLLIFRSSRLWMMGLKLMCEHMLAMEDIPITIGLHG